MGCDRQGCMDTSAGSSGRAYGRVVWEDRWLTAMYWFSTSIALFAAWASGAAAPIFRTEIAASLIVGLLGLFIALWLANRERNKRITENHFYKLQILWHVGMMLGTAFSLFRHGERVAGERSKKPHEQSGTIEGFRQHCISQCLYHKGQIEALNVNTRVPAYIRHRVLLLVQTAGHSISGYDPSDVRSNAELVEKFTLRLLDPLIDSEYFTRDRDGDVMEQLSAAKAYRDSIRGFVDSWKTLGAQ